jgi:hypothetical protein
MNTPGNIDHGGRQVDARDFDAVACQMAGEPARPAPDIDDRTSTVLSDEAGEEVQGGTFAWQPVEGAASQVGVVRSDPVVGGAGFADPDPSLTVGRRNLLRLDKNDCGCLPEEPDPSGGDLAGAAGAADGCGALVFVGGEQYCPAAAGTARGREGCGGAVEVAATRDNDLLTPRKIGYQGGGSDSLGNAVEDVMGEEAMVQGRDGAVTGEVE